MQSIKIPQNVPNLTVPATNPDITKAMGNGGKQIDLQLYRTNALIAKAIVPLASFVADVGQKKEKPAAEYLEGINSSVRMLAAAFNFVNQSRKDVVRSFVKERGLGTLCKWDSPVGEEELFPFDVTKKCDELRKVRTLGTSSGSNKNRFQNRRPTANDFKWPPRRMEQRQPFNSYSHPYQPYQPMGRGRVEWGKMPPLRENCKLTRARQCCACFLCDL